MKHEVANTASAVLMTLQEFRIGLEFWMSGRLYRCTDVGTRIVTAIRVDSAEKVRLQNGVKTYSKLSRSEAEAEGWFDGPPYGVVEFVIDEYDQDACTLEPDGDEGPGSFDGAERE